MNGRLKDTAELAAKTEAGLDREAGERREEGHKLGGGLSDLEKAVKGNEERAGARIDEVQVA